MFKKNIFVVMWLDDVGRFCCTPPPFGERLNFPKNIAYIAYIAYIWAPRCMAKAPSPHHVGNVSNAHIAPHQSTTL